MEAGLYIIIHNMFSIFINLFFFYVDIIDVVGNDCDLYLCDNKCSYFYII